MIPHWLWCSLWSETLRSEREAALRRLWSGRR